MYKYQLFVFLYLKKIYIQLYMTHVRLKKNQRSEYITRDHVKNLENEHKKWNTKNGT